MSAPAILVLSGPNLGALGRRDPAQYGTVGLAAIVERVRALADELGATIEARQSDHEGELVEAVLGARASGFAGVVVNPGALAHTSYALRDAVEAAGVPVVEVHLSNVHRRERWRHQLAVAPASAGVIAGFGPASYELGLRAVLDLIGPAGGG